MPTDDDPLEEAARLAQVVEDRCDAHRSANEVAAAAERAKHAALVAVAEELRAIRMHLTGKDMDDGET